METSTMSKSLFSCHERAFEVPEESTWTMYFQEFHNNNNNSNQESQDRFCYDNSSLISDAASIAGAAKISRKTNRSKKRRTIGKTPNFAGNDLEDTASSPSTSPKVCSMVDEQSGNETEEDMRRMNQNTECRLRRIKERMEMGLEGEDGELKKKGFCLVPLSMLTNYIA